ncbi:hypothetical protein QQP08_011289 [Theobroma cacao]|nr:hypothetical protein QQP08_011289 [Theobroma cacao]
MYSLSPKTTVSPNRRKAAFCFPKSQKEVDCWLVIVVPLAMSCALIPLRFRVIMDQLNGSLSGSHSIHNFCSASKLTRLLSLATFLLNSSLACVRFNAAYKGLSGTCPLIPCGRYWLQFCYDMSFPSFTRSVEGLT